MSGRLPRTSNSSGYGAGDILKGEGILAITKALLQSGVSYVGGYPGAPISHLLDVMADANESLLKPMGIYYELSGSEAAAAALLGASINYPMRGAVTWKSVVGTNVASDALSHVASAGVIGGSLIVIGEDYGEGASILQERTHSTALKSSIPLLDPRNSLRVVRPLRREGFGLSEACNEPVFFSIRIRACHMRGTLRAGQRSSGDQQAVAAHRAVFSSIGSTCRPSRMRWRAEVRRAAAGRAAIHRRARAQRALPGAEIAPGSSCRAGSGTAAIAACTCSASPTCAAARRSRCWCSTRCTRWCPRS